jgi:hypothetical protein
LPISSDSVADEETLELIRRDPSFFGSPENTQIALQMAILETLSSIEEKLN